MTILFAASEPYEFDADSVVYGTNTSTSYRDTAYSRMSILLYRATDFLKKTVPGQADLSFKALVHAQSANTTLDKFFMEIRSDAGAVCRVIGTGTAGALQAQRWDGVAWQNFGAAITCESGVTTGWGIRARAATDGAMQVFKNGVLVAEYLGDTSALGPLTSFVLATWVNTQFFYTSEFIAASHDIRSARLKTLAITGAGAVSEWTGAHTDISAAGSPDTSFMTSGTADQKALFLKGGLAADSYEVDAVVLSGRFRRAATGPANIDSVVRVGTVDYNLSLGALTESFEFRQSVHNVNPANSLAWARTDVENAQIGMQSRA